MAIFDGNRAVILEDVHCDPVASDISSSHLLESVHAMWRDRQGEPIGSGKHSQLQPIIFLKIWESWCLVRVRQF